MGVIEQFSHPPPPGSSNYSILRERPKSEGRMEVKLFLHNPPLSAAKSRTPYQSYYSVDWVL